ncbi:MAG TPA: hypothetical protein PKL73_01640 [Polyangiaceae bacterium]|jgi:hypothetical protein|nr:MAG: hypothetical protein BWY17_01149 [Deltaproteobacteria bacterium ADurb.Bin207]HNS95622.1 hypothetical protein [Polyangiaceae bacterium]HNZ21224.1 hypothetical protein [Polyangiaceae bacterium]HOD21090.1 hypothetical protein [Polyangiaceae bacterium]HOE48030.1 hypothetical protein [Polyangiaceae bacterium]
MTNRLLASAGILLGTMGWMGCGSTDNPIDKTPKYKYPDVSSFCEAKAKLECTNTVLTRCQTSEDACVIKRRGLCSQSAPTGAKYRPTEAEKCLAAIKGAYADDQYTAQEKAQEVDACALLWGGFGGEGASCGSNHECDLDKGLRCVKRTGAATGQCYEPEEKQSGQSCEGPDAVCMDGDFCTVSEPNVCANKRAVGSTCSESLPCKDDLRCVGDEAPTCQLKLDVGSPCGSDAECASDMCSPVASTDQCVSVIILAPNEPICANFR